MAGQGYDIYSDEYQVPSALAAIFAHNGLGEGPAKPKAKPKPKLSDPLPRGMNNKIAAAYDDVKAG